MEGWRPIVLLLGVLYLTGIGPVVNHRDFTAQMVESFCLLGIIMTVLGLLLQAAADLEGRTNWLLELSSILLTVNALGLLAHIDQILN